MKKSRSGYEETLGSNLVELPASGADSSMAAPSASTPAPSAMTNGVKETSPIEDLASLVQPDERCVLTRTLVLTRACARTCLCSYVLVLAQSHVLDL